MKKKIIKVVFLFITCYMMIEVQAFEITSGSFYDAYTWAEFSHDYTIENATGVEYHIKNQQELEKYLKKTGNDFSGDMIWFDNTEDIIFPTGTYLFNDRTEFYMPEASGDIDFHQSSFAISVHGGIYMIMIGNQHQRSFKNLTVYGSLMLEIGDTGNGYYSSGMNITRVGATAGYHLQGLYLEAIKASNMTFENLTFNTAHANSSHVFDIMGCTNMTFRNITNRGYLENWTADEFASIYNTNGHVIYSEFIQIDGSGEGSLGVKNFLSNDFATNYFLENLYSDGAPTTNTTISNVRSVGYSGINGQSILDHSTNKVIKPYASTLGAHGVYQEPYQEIVIRDGSFENVVHVNNITNNLTAPIHFVVASGTTRSNLSGKTESEIKALLQADDIWKNTSITLSNNQFIQCSSAFDNQTPNVKTDTSGYMVGFDASDRTVNQVQLVDEEGNVFKTYTGYYPEEEVYDSYVFVSSSYNSSTGVIRRLYRKKNQSVVKINQNYDEKDQLLDSTDGYEFVSTKVDYSTDEILPIGDSVSVQHITNTYKKITVVEGIPDTAAFSSFLTIFFGVFFITFGLFCIITGKYRYSLRKK